MDNLAIKGEVKVAVKEEKISYIFLKRIIDIIGAVVGLIIASPILLVVGILIKLESKGPIVFSQIRVGKNGKKFRMSEHIWFLELSPFYCEAMVRVFEGTSNWVL